MAEQGVLYAQKLYVNEFDLSGNMTSVGFECGVQGQDSTRYSTALTGSTSRTEDPGHTFAQLESSSLFEAGSGKIDTVAAGLARASDTLITFCPLTGTAGERAYLLRGITTQYRSGARVGEMLRADLSARCSANWLPGYVLFNGSFSATGSGSAFQLGAVASGKSLYAWLHVLSGTFGSITLKVQSDDNSGFTSATDRITFSAATAVGVQYATPVAGAITDDWWRVNCSALTTGPMSVVIGMAIL